MIFFIRSLKAALRSSNGVAVLSFPSSLLLPSFLMRWKHLADTLLSVSAIPGNALQIVFFYFINFLNWFFSVFSFR